MTFCLNLSSEGQAARRKHPLVFLKVPALSSAWSSRSVCLNSPGGGQVGQAVSSGGASPSVGARAPGLS